MTPDGVSSVVVWNRVTRLAIVAMVSMAAFGQPAVEVAHGRAHRELSHDEADHHHHDSARATDADPSESGFVISHAEAGHLHANADQLRSPGADPTTPALISELAVPAPVTTRLRLPPGAPPVPLQSTTAARPPTRAPPLTSR